MGQIDSIEDRKGRKDILIAFLLFLSLSVLYISNGNFLPGNDAKPNVFLAVSILTEGNPSFSIDEFPFMFSWKLDEGNRWSNILINNWDDIVQGTTARDLYEQGKITFDNHKFYLVKTNQPDVFVNTFGLGTGLFALPFFAVASLFSDAFLIDHWHIWHLSKIISSLSVSLAAVFIFLAARRFTGRLSSTLIAIIFGTATCVWSLSSQQLLQHGPNEFFLALGIYFAVSTDRHKLFATASGAALACAVLARPTSGIIVIAIGIYFAIVNRQALILFILGGLPFLLLQMIYSNHYFENPLSFGQTIIASQVALVKTGDANPWQTPFWLGGLGLSICPSRGLLVYSPIMAFALWGGVEAWREKGFVLLRVLSLSAFALFVVASRWFDWWGGWGFGYRPIVDIMPLLALLLIPVMQKILTSRGLLALFSIFLFWSIMVQVLGAYAFDIVGWNNRTIAVYKEGESAVRVDEPAEVRRISREERDKYTLISMDVDKPRFRYRLWSVTDTQIEYYLKYFFFSREQKKQIEKYYLENPST